MKKDTIKFTSSTHSAKHLPKSQHQLDPNLDLKQLVHHATVQYVDRDADGDVDVYDNPKKKIPDENVSSTSKADENSKKLIAKQKGELKHTRRGMAYEETKSGDEGLRDWFYKSKSSDGKSGWVQLGGKWAGKPCARQPGQTSTPKCGSSKMAANLSPEEEEKARKRKNRLDPNQPDKSGGAKPTNVRTEEMDLQEVKDKPSKGSGKKDACYSKVKSRYSVWPSAYASGALVKCRKVGAPNWGNKTEETHPVLNGKDGTEQRYCPLCKKRETRSECSYGAKAWDRLSIKDEEYSMARSELSTVIDAVKRLQAKVGKGEGNLEAWVQSKITKAADYIDTAADYVTGGEMDEACWDGYKRVGMKKKGKRMVPNCVPEETIEDLNGNTFAEVIDLIKPDPIKSNPIKSELEEATRLQSSTGNIIAIVLSWRGKTYMAKMFFPQATLPTRKDVESEIQKVYPNSRVLTYNVSGNMPAGEPLIVVDNRRSKNYLLNNGTIGEGTLPDAIDPKSHRLQQRAAKIRTLAQKGSTEGERKAAERKTKGPKMFGEGAAWTKKEGKNSEGGLNEKGRKSYEKENPGSDLKAPSKKVGNPRRASFCARMSGMKKKLTSKKTANDPDSRINKSLRAWNC